MHSQINEQSKKSPLKKSHELKTTIIKILIQKKKKKKYQNHLFPSRQITFYAGNISNSRKTGMIDHADYFSMRFPSKEGEEGGRGFWKRGR